MPAKRNPIIPHSTSGRARSDDQGTASKELCDIIGAGRLTIEIRVTEDSGTTSAMRILLIDDDAAVMGAIKMVLEVDSHEVVAAQSGQRGIELFDAALASRKPFDVVMTDLGMPGVDGREVARAIKRASATTPVILLTGSGENPEGIDRSGFACIVGKPLRLHEIRAALQSAIVNASGRRPPTEPAAD
jgi:DNA-binding response OmpR family regulator